MTRRAFSWPLLAVSLTTPLALAASCTLDTAGLGEGATSSGNTGGMGGTGGMSTSNTGGMTATGGMGGAGGAGSTGGMGGMGGMPPICGNGMVEAPEECDDGNFDQNDGCSPLCTKENYDKCPGTNIPLAPPGITLQGKLVGGLGNDLDPSCGPTGKRDLIYAVTPQKSGTLIATLKGNFNKSLSIRSVCSKAVDNVFAETVCRTNGNGDTEQKLWVHTGVTYYVVVDGDNDGAFDLDLKLEICGDGQVNGLEQCDDPNDATCIGCLKCNGAGEFWDPTGKHCYYRESAALPAWADARKSCVAMGSDLAAPSTKAEFEFLIAQVQANMPENIWLGGYAVTQGCSFAWTNGEPWRSEWADAEPNLVNNRCLGMYSNKGLKMTDSECTLILRRFICERAPAGTCGDGIVQPGERCDDKNNNPNDGCDNCQIKQPPCDTNGAEFEDPATKHCYRHMTTVKNWNDAKLECEKIGGYLAVVESTDEQNLLAGKITGDTWIGGRQGSYPDKDTNAVWERENSACFKKWAGGEPSSMNEGCVEMVKSKNGDWNDADCNNGKDFVCEREP